MGTVYEQPDAQGPAHQGSQPPQTGAGFPAGPGLPPGGDGWHGYYGYGYGYGPQFPPPPPPRRQHRILTGVVAAVAAFAIGGGVTALVTGINSGSASSGKALSTSAIVKKTDPAVVDIVSQLSTEGEESAGTGMVLTSNGEILTNNHVIDGATSIRVTDIGNGRTYTATVVGYDVSKDVAILQLKDASGLTTASIGNSDSATVGSRVVAIGNAEGKGGLPSVVTGTVGGLDKSITAEDEGSGSSERLTGMVEDNAKIEPGDSGGPLLNSQGQVVGMDTAADTGSSAGSFGSQSTQTAEEAFAIPINTAMTVAKEIVARDASSTVHIGATAFIGVEVEPETQTGGAAGGFGEGGFGSSGSGQGSQSVKGALVEGVVSGDAAAQAGITAGSTITSLGGHKVTSSTSLRNVLVGLNPGQKVSIHWTTESGQHESATITLGSGPAA